MLIPYTIDASDLGSALAIAQQRAMRDGYSHVSINSTHQVGRTEWVITVFAANSNALSQRQTPPWAGDHWCQGPGCRHHG